MVLSLHFSVEGRDECEMLRRVCVARRDDACGCTTHAGERVDNAVIVKDPADRALDSLAVFNGDGDIFATRWRVGVDIGHWSKPNIEALQELVGRYVRARCALKAELQNLVYS